jgi:hypothetical protein
LCIFPNEVLKSIVSIPVIINNGIMKSTVLTYKPLLESEAIRLLPYPFTTKLFFQSLIRTVYPFLLADVGHQ